jgi:acyl carrier protein
MESEKSIFDAVYEMILAYYPELKDKKIEMDTPITGESGVDSLGFIFVVAKIENKYGIKISNHAISSLVTIGDVVRLIEKKLSHKK